MENKILILLVIIIIKAIFSAFETAITYVKKAKIAQMSKTDKKAKRINALIKDSHKFYGIIEVVITMCELFATIFVAEDLILGLNEKLRALPISQDGISVISTILITMLLSYVLLIFGSILPKKSAKNHPEQTAFRWINMVWFVSKINYPFEKLLLFSTKVFSKVFGIKENPDKKLTEREIKMIINEGHEQGIIAKAEKEIVFNALRFDDILVKDIMIPKEKVVFVNVTEEKEKIFDIVQKYKHTRIPVYEKNKDNIIGIFNVKDLAIEYAKNNDLSLNIKELLRQVLFVEKEQKISEVFKEMQLNNQAISVIIDKDKKVIGIVTMEDTLEKIVGRIFDEFDKK